MTALRFLAPLGRSELITEVVVLAKGLSGAVAFLAWGLMAGLAVGQEPNPAWFAAVANQSALDRAATLLADAQFDAAIRICDEVLARDPGCTEAYVQRYIAHMGENRFDRALADSEEILKREPKHRGAISVRALVFVREARYEEALQTYTRLIEIGPTDATAYADRALVWYRMGEWEEACADFDQALRVNPRNPQAYRARADCRQRRGELAEATADYKAAVKADDGCHAAHLELARILSRAKDDKLRDGKRALEHAKRAVALTNGKDYNSFDALASAQAELGQFAEAVEVARKALGLAQQGSFTDFQAIRSRLDQYRAGQPCRE